MARGLTVDVALDVAEGFGLPCCASDSSSAPVAFDIHFEDCGVVDEAINGRERHCGIRKDARPLAEGVIGGHHETAPLVAGGDELEQD